MYRILFFILMMVLFILLYNILSIIFNVERRDTVKAYNSAKIKKSSSKNPKYMFAKYIRLSNYKKDELNAKLYSLDIELTAEEWISQYIFNFVIFIPVILFMFSLKIYILAVILTFLNIIIFLDSMDKINRMITFRRTKIEEEAPNLIRFFMVSLKNTSDIKQIFENYVDLAGYLKRDINITITDMNSMRNQKDNLVRSLELLDDRLNTPIMNDFITGLINVTMGKNQDSYFMLLERELKDLSMINLDRKSKKVEKVIRNYSYILIILFVVFVITEFVTYIISALRF